MTEEQRQKLYDEGYCDKDLALRLGVSQPTITRWRQRRGLPLVFENRQRLTDWEIEQIQEFLACLVKFTRVKRRKTLEMYEKGLNAFVIHRKSYSAITGAIAIVTMRVKLLVSNIITVTWWLLF